MDSPWEQTLKCGRFVLKPYGIRSGGEVASWHHQAIGERWDFMYCPDCPDPSTGGIALVKDSVGSTKYQVHVDGPEAAGNLFLRYWEEW